MRAHVAEPVVENIKVDNEKRDRRKKDISAKLDETCRNSKTDEMLVELEEKGSQFASMDDCDQQMQATKDVETNIEAFDVVSK